MALFSKRHYEVLASTLSRSTNKQHNPHPVTCRCGAAAQHQHEVFGVNDFIILRDNLVNVLELDNPRFDKFLRATADNAVVAKQPEVQSTPARVVNNG